MTRRMLSGEMVDKLVRHDSQGKRDCKRRGGRMINSLKPVISERSCEKGGWVQSNGIRTS